MVHFEMAREKVPLHSFRFSHPWSNRLSKLIATTQISPLSVHLKLSGLPSAVSVVAFPAGLGMWAIFHQAWDQHEKAFVRAHAAERPELLKLTTDTGSAPTEQAVGQEEEQCLPPTHPPIQTTSYSPLLSPAHASILQRFWKPTYWCCSSICSPPVCPPLDSEGEEQAE